MGHPALLLTLDWKLLHLVRARKRPSNFYLDVNNQNWSHNLTFYNREAPILKRRLSVLQQIWSRCHFTTDFNKYSPKQAIPTDYILTPKENENFYRTNGTSAFIATRQ